MICVTLATEGQITTSIENRAKTFVPKTGTVAIVPVGLRCASRGTGAMESIILMVPKDTLAYATAERAKAGARLIERLSGEDAVLLRLALLLTRQVAEGFVDDPLAWFELTDAVLEQLINVHLSEPPSASRGRLDAGTVARVIDFIHANVERPIEVDELADAAQRSWSHFPRLFRRSTGLSPYQYVTKVRLQQAICLLRTTRLTLAEVAVRAGFADQSHFCRWVRRVYGISPTQLLAGIR